MDSERDIAYRLGLAEGFLREAEQDVTLSRWRACVDNAQLSVENSVKAVIARYAPVPRTHDLTRPLGELQTSTELNAAQRKALSELTACAVELGWEQHVRSDYGEEATFTTPWELFDEDDARGAVGVATRALALARAILEHGSA